MREICLESGSNPEFAIILAILTKTTAKIKGFTNLDEFPFANILKVISPGTELEIVGCDLRIIPGPFSGGKYNIRIGSEDIVHNLRIIEPLTLIGLFGEHTFDLKIENITNFGEPVDSFDKIYCVILKMFGASPGSISVKKRGFPPLGGGEMHLKIEPIKELQYISLKEREELEYLDVLIVTSRISADFLKRSTTFIRNKLEIFAENIKIASLVHNKNDSGPSPGAECTIVASGSKSVFFSIAAHNTPEETGEESCNELIQSINQGGNIDYKLLSFTFILMGLAKGVSRLRCGKLSECHWRMLNMLKVFLEIEFSVINVGEDEVVVNVIGSNFVNPFIFI